MKSSVSKEKVACLRSQWLCKHAIFELCDRLSSRKWKSLRNHANGILLILYNPVQQSPEFVSALHVLVSSESRNIKNIFVILQLWVKEYQKYLCYFTALTRNIKNIFVILQLWVKECQKYLCKFAALSQRILQIFLWFYKSSQIRYVCELGVIKRTNIGDTNLQRLYLSIYLLLIP